MIVAIISDYVYMTMDSEMVRHLASYMHMVSAKTPAFMKTRLLEARRQLWQSSHLHEESLQ